MGEGKIELTVQELEEIKDEATFRANMTSTQKYLVKNVISINELLKGNGDLGMTSKVSILWKSSVFIVVITVGTFIKTFF